MPIKWRRFVCAIEMYTNVADCSCNFMWVGRIRKYFICVLGKNATWFDSRQWSYTHVLYTYTYIYFNIEGIFRPVELIFVSGEKGYHNCITKVLPTIQNVQSLMCLRRKKNYFHCIVVLTHLFLLSTHCLMHIYDIPWTARFFSQKTRRIFYCVHFRFTHHVSGIFFLCHAIAGLPSHFSYFIFIFNGRSRTKPLMPAPNTFPNTNKNTHTHIIFCSVTAFFACQTHIFITHNVVWKSNFKCEKNSTFSLQSSPMLKSKSSCGRHKIWTQHRGQQWMFCVFVNVVLENRNQPFVKIYTHTLTHLSQ